ncbi:hypothetical protein CQ12_13785 [Bradyrhizobium jicamae]|uniref:Uncharacterized protein n=1 Tax=Bradyrhizobium jicamae TaxID=280332 RepID=A0A0R3LP69_9BRAD|nr:hypothetical protein [Bradyrhizobium jicamae]KRR09554.1 hypothetical protein CQ12_13785 [Bradyrhizobium jicamae]
MFKSKEFTTAKVVVGCALSAYVAGEHLQYSKAPAKHSVSLTIASSTSAVATYNMVTFAQLEPPPPVVPPEDRQEQT